MERRYLVATLALAVTFSLVSHGLRSGHLPQIPHSRAELAADIACARNYVAEQLMAKLAPYADHNPAEEAQMLAELSMPNLDQIRQQASDAETLVAGQIVRQKCEAAQRARQAQRQVLQMPDVSIVRAEEFSDRARELSDRAREWSDMANEHSLQIQVQTLEHAQQMSARVMERAQRAIEQSQRRMSHSAQPGMPIHINLVTPVHFEFTVPAPVAPAPPSPTIN